jgi:hypothetical protein
MLLHCPFIQELWRLVPSLHFNATSCIHIQDLWEGTTVVHSEILGLDLSTLESLEEA